MKVAGALVLVCGFLLAAGLSLVPTHISVLGTSGDCGAPIVRAFAANTATDSLDRSLTDQCKSQSATRLFMAVVLGGIATFGGIVMVAIGQNAARAPAIAQWMLTDAPGWYADPSRRHPLRYWNGASWTDHVSDGHTSRSDPPYS